MKIVSFTGIGRRNRNEDAYAVVEMPEQGRMLAIVCDGMGGHGYGDEASQTVVKAISNYWTGNPKRHDSEKKIVDAVAQAGIIYEKKTCGREMGATLTMVAIEDGRFISAIAGIVVSISAARAECVSTPMTTPAFRRKVGYL